MAPHATNMKSLTVILLMIGLQAVMSFDIRDLETPTKRCSVPRKFEGKIKLTMKMGPKQVLLASGIGTFHADDTIGKAATLEKVTSRGQTIEVNTYISNNITYVAMPAMKQCQKNPSAGPIIPVKVPPGFTLKVKRGVLHGVPVQIWEFVSKPGLTDGTMTLYLTEAKCMPMRLEMQGMASGQTMHMVEDFSDMKEGIKDPRVFNLPRYCMKYGGESYPFLLSTNIDIKHAIRRHEMCSWILFGIVNHR